MFDEQNLLVFGKKEHLLEKTANSSVPRTQCAGFRHSCCSFNVPLLLLLVDGLRKEVSLAQPTASGNKECGWEKEGPSGKEQQEQRKGYEDIGELLGWGSVGKEVGHCRVGIALSRLKPLLETSPTAPVLRTCLEGVAPNLLT